MRILTKSLLYTALIWLSLLSTAQAALLGLVPDLAPDAKTWNSIDYTYANGTDGSNGFNMVIGGFVSSLADSTGPLTNPLGDAGCSGGTGLACYSLTASFDSSGAMIPGGSISISYIDDGLAGSGHTTGGGKVLTSYDLVTGSLKNFGFGSAPSATNDASGLFEFTFDIISGDFLDVWGGINGGSIINTINLLDGNYQTLDTGGLSWDDYGLMTTEFHAFLDGDTTGDTFIPIPAAVWLFGSGLVALGAIARRRKSPAAS